MPTRNIVKTYSTNTFYHIYNRGVEKRQIYITPDDYSVFLNLIKRYLSKQPVKDSKGREYEWFTDKIELLAFCLMPNHFHLLIYQKDDPVAITRLLRAVCSSYTTYFNKKHRRVGKLFQGHFKATIIQTEPYLLHISRYIHLNPENYSSWEWSSLPYYLGKKNAEWVDPRRITSMFDGRYSTFVTDYKSHRDSLKMLKDSLANG